MKKVDWSYHRPGCATCKKTQEFLTAAGITPKVEVNAKKERIDATAAIALARTVKKLYATKGSKLVLIDMSRTPASDELLEQLVVGPSGNLRAPTLIVGKTMVVGFNQEVYQDL